MACPVAITEKLLALLLNKGNESPFVRRIVKSKSKERFHESRGVSYTTIKDGFKKLLKPFFEDINCFGLRSIKSGAASNPDCRSVSNDLIDKHGV